MKIYLTLIYLFLFSVCSYSIIHSQSDTKLLLQELPLNIYSELVKHMDKYNKEQPPIDEHASYDPIITKVSKQGYLLDNKYIIPIVKSGSSYSLTVFFLCDSEITTEFVIRGYVFEHFEKTLDSSLLKVIYSAGCCDARFFAVGLISIETDTLQNLFTLPLYGQNTENRSDGGEFNTSISFELTSSLDITQQIQSDKYLIEQKYWFNKDHNEHSLNYANVELPDKESDFLITMIYDKKERNISLVKKNEKLNRLLIYHGFPNKSVNPLNLMDMFIQKIME